MSLYAEANTLISRVLPLYVRIPILLEREHPDSAEAMAMAARMESLRDNGPLANAHSGVAPLVRVVKSHETRLTKQEGRQRLAVLRAELDKVIEELDPGMQEYTHHPDIQKAWKRVTTQL